MISKSARTVTLAAARRPVLLLLTVVLFVGTPRCKASGSREIDEFAQVVHQVREYAKEHSPEKILLVADIDNTLLAMDREYTLSATGQLRTRVQAFLEKMEG